MSQLIRVGTESYFPIPVIGLLKQIYIEIYWFLQEVISYSFRPQILEASILFIQNIFKKINEMEPKPVANVTSVITTMFT